MRQFSDPELDDNFKRIQAELRVMGDRITKVEQRLGDAMQQEPEICQQYDKEQDLAAIRKERDYWRGLAKEYQGQLEAQDMVIEKARRTLDGSERE